jgi:hypothetical protein
MKLATALRYADEIAARLRRVNGLIATPLCDWEAVRIRRAWIFGSTVKGSQTPNDLDVLLDLREVGLPRRWRNGKLDKRALRSYGYWRAINSTDEALKWISKGMKKVSRHLVETEKGLDLSPMVMIYPRNDLPAYMERLKESHITPNPDLVEVLRACPWHHRLKWTPGVETAPNDSAAPCISGGPCDYEAMKTTRSCSAGSRPI